MMLVYWSQPSSVVLCIQNSAFSIRINSLYGSQPSSVVLPCKTAPLGTELQISTGPRPHLWFFLHSKQRLQHQNCKSQCVQALICGFCMQNSGFWIRIKRIYGSQTSPAVFCKQNSAIIPRITSIHWSQTSPVVLCIQNNVIRIRITSLYWSQPSTVVFACKAATFGSELQVSMSPRLRLLICESKTACLEPE